MHFLLAGLALQLVLSSALFAQKMILEYDHSRDFSGYRKYEWKQHPFLDKHPESKQFTVGTELVQSNVNQILMKRGYEPVDFGPEFYLALFITASMRQETHSTPAVGPYPPGYMWPGGWYSWSAAWFPAWDTEVVNYAQGILLLDVVDAKSRQLLWRAVIRQKIDDMRERHKKIEDAVKKAMGSFPPKFKQP